MIGIDYKEPRTPESIKSHSGDYNDKAWMDYDIDEI
jgi:hypothetical protein